MIETEQSGGCPGIGVREMEDMGKKSINFQLQDLNKFWGSNVLRGDYS